MTLESPPTWEKYQSNFVYVENLQAALLNPINGGSVFNPIRGAKDEKPPQGKKKIEKSNLMRENIHNVPIDNLSGGGFYILKNVRTARHTFMDIIILVDGGITSSKDIVRLQNWHRKSTDYEKKEETEDFLNVSFSVQTQQPDTMKKKQTVKFEPMIKPKDDNKYNSAN